MSLASSSPLWATLSTYLLAAAPYLAAGAALLCLLLIALHLSLRRRLKRLALGRNGSLEETLAILTREMKEHREFRTELEQYLKRAEARLRGALSGVGIVRFNPFEGSGQGGNQSSAVALLDESGGGVVLSTLYSRDRVAVYTKPVEKGSSPFELTQEEKSAIAKAQAHLAAHTRSAAAPKIHDPKV